MSARSADNLGDVWGGTTDSMLLLVGITRYSKVWNFIKNDRPKSVTFYKINLGCIESSVTFFIKSVTFYKINLGGIEKCDFFIKICGIGGIVTFCMESVTFFIKRTSAV